MPLNSFHIDYATYLGGSIDDFVAGITLDSAGNIYVTGGTDSPDFPLTSTAFGVPSLGNGCAFITKLSPGATSMVWSICIMSESASGISVDAAGDVYILARSTPESPNSIIKIDPSGSQMIYSKPLGEKP